MSVLLLGMEDASSACDEQTAVQLITIVMSSAIAATPQRVWQALTVPSECMSWDENLLSAVDPVDAYPKTGEIVRWQYRMGSVPIVMREEPIEIVLGRKLRSKVTLGSLHFDQTYTLALEQDLQSGADAIKTVLGMKVIASNSAAVLGAVIDRFEVRRMTADRVDATLRAITKWCEGE